MYSIAFDVLYLIPLQAKRQANTECPVTQDLITAECILHVIRRKINRGLICHNEPIKTQFIRAIISAPNGLNIIVSVALREFRLKVLHREHQGVLLHEFSNSF